MNIVHVHAHQDDEGWALGTLIKYRNQGGHSITFICTTNGDKGLSFKPDIPLSKAAAVRDREMTAVAEAMGARYICLGEEDEFLYDTKETRLALIDALREAEAELIFTGWKYDYNADHTATSGMVSQCAMNAMVPSVVTDHPPLKTTPRIFYCDVGEGFGFEPTHFVSLEPEVVEEKIRIIRLHKSQVEVMDLMDDFQSTENSFPRMLRRRAVSLGGRLGVPFAEGFIPCLETRRTPFPHMLPE